METPATQSATSQSVDGAPSPLYLVEKVIDIFGWVVKFLLTVGLIVILFYGAFTLTLLILQLSRPSAVAPDSIRMASDLIDATYDKLNPVVGEFWSLLKPALQLIIIVVLLRWLLFSRQGQLAEETRNLLTDTPAVVAIIVIGAVSLIAILGISIPPALANIALIVIVLVLIRWLLFSKQGQLSGQVRSLFADVPSAIALLVIGTICLITVLGLTIPESLGNVALVIVGFYFGQVLLKRKRAQGDSNVDSPVASQPTTGDEATAIGKTHHEPPGD